MTMHNEEVKETSPLSGKPHGIKRLFRKLVPYGFCYEAKKQIEMAIPVFLSQMMVFLIITVSSVFCGRLGKIELDSVMLASAVINISGLSISSGLVAGCDTLMSQTYGSKNLKRVGTILQRGIIVLMLCCFPCWAVLINTEQILLLCKQNPEIARLTQKYVMIFLPGLPAIFLQHLQSKYLQNQGIIWPQCFTGFVVNIINAIINAIFMYVFRMGVEGSAWANTISQWAMSLTLFLYIISKKLHVETWGGWSTDCLQEWGLYLHLAIPSLLMIGVEWWCMEIGSFLAGLISVVELGGQAIMIGLITLVAMLPIGFGMAANVRIGTALGAGDIEQAQKTSKVVLICTALACLFVSSTLLALKNVIGYVFTSDRDIVTLVSKIILLVAPFHVCDGINQTCSGILRGTGKQKIGAITNTFGYYLIGIPVGLTLMFVAKLGIIGLWIGLFCPILLQTCIYIPYILCINWQKACDEARIRAGVKPLIVSDPRTSQTDVLKPEFGSMENGGTTRSDIGFKDITLHDMASGEDHTKQLELKNDQPIQATNVVGEILSTKQLVIRRGLAVLLCISTLLIGITVKLTTSKK